MSSLFTPQLDSLKKRVLEAYNVEPNKYDRKGIVVTKVGLGKYVGYILLVAYFTVLPRFFEMVLPLLLDLMPRTDRFKLRQANSRGWDTVPEYLHTFVLQSSYDLYLQGQTSISLEISSQPGKSSHYLETMALGAQLLKLDATPQKVLKTGRFQQHCHRRNIVNK